MIKRSHLTNSFNISGLEMSESYAASSLCRSRSEAINDDDGGDGGEVVVIAINVDSNIL